MPHGYIKRRTFCVETAASSLKRFPLYLVYMPRVSRGTVAVLWMFGYILFILSEMVLKWVSHWASAFTEDQCSIFPLSFCHRPYYSCQKFRINNSILYLWKLKNQGWLHKSLCIIMKCYTNKYFQQHVSRSKHFLHISCHGCQFSVVFTYSTTHPNKLAY